MIGPDKVPGNEIVQAVSEIEGTRIILVVSLHEDGPYNPEVVPADFTGSFPRLIENGNPRVSVELATGDEDNPTEEATIAFSNLKSFRPDDLEKRIPILQKQRALEDRYQRIKAEVERSKRLQEIIQDPVKKATLLDVLHSIREELIKSFKN